MFTGFYNKNQKTTQPTDLAPKKPSLYYESPAPRPYQHTLNLPERESFYGQVSQQRSKAMQDLLF